MKKYTLFILFIVSALALIFTGCEKSIPFQKSPDAVAVKSVEDGEEFSKEYPTYYKDHISWKFSPSMPDSLRTAIKKMVEGKSEAEGKKISNAHQQDGDCTFVYYLESKTNEKYVDDSLLNEAKSYIEKTRIGRDEGSYQLTKEFSQLSPEAKVSDYIAKNKITISSIDFPEAFEDKDTLTYPMKFTLRYVIKGTKGRKAFETEVAQNFYFSLDMSGINKTDFSKSTINWQIAGIKDVVENTKK